jgi:hypothetical protein
MKVPPKPAPVAERSVKGAPGDYPVSPSHDKAGAPLRAISNSAPHPELAKRTLAELNDALARAFTQICARPARVET